MRSRLEMSERYLKDSGLTVPEISFLLGFRDTSSFFRAFHGWTGKTPGDYRASGSDNSLCAVELTGASTDKRLSSSAHIHKAALLYSNLLQLSEEAMTA